MLLASLVCAVSMHALEQCQNVTADMARLRCFDQAMATAEPATGSMRIRTVQRDAYGKLIVTVADGRTWRQTDGAVLRLQPGDQVVIRSAAAGSYLLSKVTGGTGVRVRLVGD